MVDHSGDLNALMDSMLMLDYQFVEQTARKVAAAPALPRPVHGETNTLSASVPTRFFDLQDLLTKQLKALADAAHARDSVKSAHAFSQITETCVSCHSEFMWQSSGNQH
jgi:cytochrome c556